MKNLTKLLLIAIIFSLSNNMWAQKFGVKAGLNLANMLIKDDQSESNTKMKIGFHIGGVGEMSINEMISLEAGLLLSTKGYKAEESGVKTTCNLMYIDIPIDAKAKFDVGGLKVFGFAGPYFGMGLSGKTKTEGDVMGVSMNSEDDIKWGSGDDAMLKRLDFGLTVGAGVQIDAIEVSLAYNLGLANISATTDGGSKVKNKVIGLSVAYKFGK